MKKITSLLALAASVFTLTAQAATYHVATTGNDTNPGTSSSPKRTIQAAIDIAAPGDTITVADGTYAPIDTANKAITIQSLNGSAHTLIDGGGTDRCAMLGKSSSIGDGQPHGNDTLLSGFTLTNGVADGYGGAVYCGTLVNCVLTGNSARFGGAASDVILYTCTLTGNSADEGGAVSACTLYTCTLTDNFAEDAGGAALVSTLNNCLLTGNSARYAGAVSECTLNNCTLTGNSASSGGGAAWSTLNNCIVWDNTADDEPNHYDCFFNYSCTIPMPDDGDGNIDDDPSLNGHRLSAGSPCIDTGLDILIPRLTDLDGKPRILGETVDMGAYEWGTPPPNFPSAQLYVDETRPDNTGDGTSWSTAKQSIMAAVVLAADNATITVADGTYTPIVTTGKALTIQSVNGAEETTIDACWLTRCATLGGADESEDNTVLTGFTLMSGWAEGSGGGVFGGTLNNCVLGWNRAEFDGGGAACSTLNNCTLEENESEYFGGGAVLCTLNNCTLQWNTATSESGGGAYECTLNNCTLQWNTATSEGGGGAYECTLDGCVLTENTADWGGGAYFSDLRNCTLEGNEAIVGGGAAYSTLNNCILSENLAEYGGGACEDTLNNCVLTENDAYEGGGAHGGTLNNCTLIANSADYVGGVLGGILNNCIVWGNTADDEPNHDDCEINYSCTTPMPLDGDGNISSNPNLTYSYRLNANSPCIDCGSDLLVSSLTDRDGKPRILGAAVDMGAYESGTPPPFQMTLHVDDTRPDSSGDGTTLQTAKQSIMAALVIAAQGATINVADGTYPPLVTHNLPLTIQSLNGADHTFIDGAYAARCATLGANATQTNTTLIGFTLMNGTAEIYADGGCGGGVRGGTLFNCILTNNATYCGGGAAFSILNTCTLANNTAYEAGGGAFESTLNTCTLTANSAGYIGGGAAYSALNTCTLTGNLAYEGGGAFESTLNTCTLTANEANNGGGAIYGTLNTCTLTANQARYGGGAYGGILNTCTLTGNLAYEGGGAYSSLLNNSLLTANEADLGGGASRGIINNSTLADNTAVWYGGGTARCIINNSIVWDNLAPYDENHCASIFIFSCTFPMPEDNEDLGGNIDGAPLFLAPHSNDYRLQSASPCINAGNNALTVGTTDLAGNPRTIALIVDMGAYEYDGIPTLTPYQQWLIDNALPNTDANRTQWLIDPTRLTNSLTAHIHIIDGTPCITWAPNRPDRTYTVWGAPTLGTPFTTPTNTATHFFRVRVEE